MDTHDTFIQKLSEHLQSHYDLTRQEVVVVFPNKRAAFYLRSQFKQNCSNTLWLPQMLSIQEAVNQWSGMTVVDNLELLFELIDIDAQLHDGRSSDLNVFGSQALQMAKDFDEIDQYDADAKHIFNYITENKRIEFWNFDEAKSKEKELKYLQFFNTLYDYYLQLRERLFAKKQGYYGMITKYLSNLSDAELVEKTQGKSILFAGFNALTTTESRLIEKLVRNGKAEVVFDYDRHYIDDVDNEAGLFARRYRKQHPEWLANGITDKLRQEEKHIHLVSAGGNILQTKALQEKLQAEAHHDIAVILADENLLIPVLNAIPDTETFQDFKVSMGYPIRKTPVNQLITTYFQLHRQHKLVRKVVENGVERQAEGWYIWPILQALDLEIVKIIFTRNEKAAFDRWKAQKVKEGKFVFESQDIDSLKGIKSFQAFVRLLLADDATQDPKGTLRSLNALLSFIANTIQSREDHSELLFLLNQVSEVGKIVNRIGQLLERHPDVLRETSHIETLYKLLVSNTSIKLNGSSTEGLQIMGLLETRNIDFKHLHVLSVNEGILPADKSQGSFIPHYIKRECGLPGYAEKQAVFAYHFYRLLQNGNDIYLYYNNLGESSGGEASRYLLQIKNELARNPNIHLHEEIFSCDTHDVSATISLSAQKEPYMAQLNHLIKEKGLSPSALSTYLCCPMKYYLKYIQQIEDNLLEEEVGSNIVGTIIHDTLELLFMDYLPKDGNKQIIDKELFDNVIQPKWETLLAQSIQKNMPCGFPDVGFNYLNKITIRQQLENYLQYTSKQLRTNDLIILETEGELKARLSTPDGDCLFVGRTDRIDQWGNVVRVIDYKTGTVENANVTLPVRKATDDDLAFLKTIPEKALQLLLYKYLYLKENPAVAPSYVEAAIHGLRYRNTIVFSLHPNGKDGVPFLEDDTFIDDMEKMLRAVVAEMLDTETPFVQTDDNSHCLNCDFCAICKRNKTAN